MTKPVTFDASALGHGKIEVEFTDEEWEQIETAWPKIGMDHSQFFSASFTFANIHDSGRATVVAERHNRRGI